MSRFKLKETTFNVRDQEVTVRELTQAQRAQFSKDSTADKFRAPALIASLGLVTPAMSEKEIGDEPSDVVTAIVEEIMILSGLKKREIKPKEGEVVAKEGQEETAQKESDAG